MTSTDQRTGPVTDLVRLAAIICVSYLTACGAAGCADEDRTLTAEEQLLADAIESRQYNMKDMGSAFKSITDEVRSGSSDRNLMFYSAKAVQTSARSHAHWFPPGSGPELGVETRALREIWLQNDVFEAGVDEFIAESNDLVAVLQTDDTDEHAAQLKRTADTCKACHDQFRRPDD